MILLVYAGRRERPERPDPDMTLTQAYRRGWADGVASVRIAWLLVCLLMLGGGFVLGTFVERLL